MSYFRDDDALTLYFVDEEAPVTVAHTLPCGWCTSRNAMINLDCSQSDVLVSMEVLDVRAVFRREFVATIPTQRGARAPRRTVPVPIAYFPWSDEVRFTFSFESVQVQETAVCGEWDEVGRDIRLEFDRDGRFVRLWIAKASARLDPWLLRQLPVAGDFGR